MEAGDIIIDGGNSFYKDDIRRAAELKKRGIDYMDAGTSGGVWGVERGYCLMIGGQMKRSTAWNRFSKLLLQVSATSTARRGATK